MITKEDFYRRKAAKEDERKVRLSNSWQVKLKDPMTLFTALVALFTFFLVVVAALQWQTLEKTDRTLRAGQRAFVFPKWKNNNWTKAETKGATIIRQFYVEWENNGNSQTKDLKVSLYCPRPDIFEQKDPITTGKFPIVFEAPRLLGPKQSIIGGSCNYSISELEDVRDKSLPMFIAARATYLDIFNDRHVTEYCVRIIELSGDFRKLEAVPEHNLVACDAHNCADEECVLNK